MLKATTITEIDDAGSTTKFKIKDVWRYCSGGWNKPTLVNEDTTPKKPNYEGGTYGKINEGNLVSVTDESNDWFWDLRNQEFFGEGKYSIATGENTKSDATNSLFKDLYESKSKPDRKNVREICASAYILNSTTGTNKVTSEKLIKYCSLTGQKN